MNVVSNQFESTVEAKPQFTLSEVDWRVWFCGYGLGGCLGLCLCAGIWSLIVDENKLLGSMALIISTAHAFILAAFWLSRSATIARSATRISFSVGALGIASVALLMTMGGSKVPALGCLYSLAIMNAIMAFTVPLLMQQRNC